MAKIKLNNNEYQISDSTLATPTADFIAHLATITGTGLRVVVGGVEYNVDVNKTNAAVTKLSEVFEGLSSGSEEPEAPVASQGLAFTLKSSNTYEVSGIGECTDLDVVIPSTYEDLPVTAISATAFNNCSNLTSVVVPDSVTSIGNGAFFGCSGLEEITLPFVGAKAGVTGNDKYQYPLGYIFGTHKYAGSEPTEQQYFGQYVSESTITSSTYYIPTSLKKVTITGGNILRGAFYNCLTLTSVVLGDGVTSIGGSAFYNCDSLTSVEIGDGVTTIDDWAFYNCDGLTSVVIGDGVTTIGDWAFYECISLTSVEIGASVKTIGDFAFQNCHSLTSVVIPDGVTSIGSYAFDYCTSLTNVEIPDSVTSIGNHAFSSCPSLVEIYYAGTEEHWKTIQSGNLGIAAYVKIHYDFVMVDPGDSNMAILDQAILDNTILN